MARTICPFGTVAKPGWFNRTGEQPHEPARALPVRGETASDPPSAPRLYNLPMRSTEAPEFSLRRPLSSALAVIRGVLFSPRNFYLGFSAEGPMREPAVFVLLVGAVTGVLTALVAILSGLLFGEVSAKEVGLTALEALLFALLSPLAVGVVAGVYLLSIRTFVGKVASFRGVYRMAAYAFGALVLAWIPLVGVFAITYALLYVPNRQTLQAGVPDSTLRR